MKELRYTNTVPPQPYWYDNGVSYPLTAMADSPSVDAFARARVSNPESVFDAQFTYDLEPLLYQQITAGTGATIVHDATNRCALMSFSGTSSGTSLMQSYEFVRCQPGKSQQIFIAFNFMSATAGVLKFAGYSDGSNGIEFRLNGSTPQVAVLSTTDNPSEVVNQASWNLDKLDGTGASGITLDITRAQVLVIDLQAQYVGRVRLGFYIDGVIVYFHEFRYSNRVYVPSRNSENFPVRCGMTCTAASTSQMRFICGSVVREGGQEDTSGFLFAAHSSLVSVSSNVRTHVISIRPTLTYNSIVNRMNFSLDSIEIANHGNNPVLWEICVGQAITSSTWSPVNSTYSGFEVGSGTISGAPALVVTNGVIAATASSKSSSSARTFTRYPITLDAAGAHRALGTLSVIATGLGGGADIYVGINWHEHR